jgi:hypothetical protein
MQKTLVVALFLFLGAQSALAQQVLSHGSRPGKGRWWKTSLAVLAAATAVDAHSSWGRLEANPALRGPNGRFGTKGLAIKGMVLGGVVGAQYFLLRNQPKAEKYAAITNFALSGVLAGVAVSNYQRHTGIPRPARFTASNPR